MGLFLISLKFVYPDQLQYGSVLIAGSILSNAPAPPAAAIAADDITPPPAAIIKPLAISLPIIVVLSGTILNFPPTIFVPVDNLLL